MKRISMTLALLICALPCFAQTQKSEAAKDWIDQWKNATNQLISIAEAMPVEKYSYKPVKEVDDFGDQLKHAGLAMRVLLANAEGKKVDLKEVSLGMDKLKTKEEIIAELRKIADEGSAVVNRVAGKNDGDIVESQFFGKTTRRFLLIQAISHNRNHYGQLVYYLRLNGITPPASRG
ncbi:MAG: DinB family protein [Blastocatellales bacterium]